MPLNAFGSGSDFIRLINRSNQLTELNIIVKADVAKEGVAESGYSRVPLHAAHNAAARPSTVGEVREKRGVMATVRSARGRIARAAHSGCTR